MALLGSIFKGLTGVGRTGLGMARSGPLGRAALGGMIGGATSYLGSDIQNPNLRFEAMTKGAVFGAVFGGVAPSVIKNIAKNFDPINLRGINQALQSRNPIGPRFRNGLFETFGPLTQSETIRRSASAQFARSSLAASGIELAKAGRFAFEHPGLLIGAGAGIMATNYAFGHASSSPTLSGVQMKANYNQQAIAAEELTGGLGTIGGGMVGSAPAMMGPMSRAFQNSTNGLTFGLNRGRHG